MTDAIDRWVVEVPDDWLDEDGWPAEVRLESGDGRWAECEVVRDE